MVQDEPKAAFSSFDRDGDHEIDPDDVLVAMGKIGTPITRDEAARLCLWVNGYAFPHSYRVSSARFSHWFASIPDESGSRALRAVARAKLSDPRGLVWRGDLQQLIDDFNMDIPKEDLDMILGSTPSLSLEDFVDSLVSNWESHDKTPSLTSEDSFSTSERAGHLR
ncbi:MAG: hypothetical protein KVP17_001459 [Porospora cf. gigantea B]|uniref:uncharacterized protein n=1 Tax=Porospora cf. gigantea B TaxID=2853592 RepID=UPI003571E464|nr:MAG: hypothetical protein KVP17_001459 [Porospora cf. gigantea B]